MRFDDREEAGRRLAPVLAPYRPERPIVLSVGLGGVPVAFAIASALGAQIELLAGGRPTIDVALRHVLVVDDGGAPAAAVRDAVRALRERSAAEVVLVAPVVTEEVEAACSADVDAIVTLDRPVKDFTAAAWYDRAGPVSESEAVAYLSRAPDVTPARWAG